MESRASGRSPVPTGRPQGGRGADLLIWGAPALFSVRLLVWARFHVDSDCWYLVYWRQAVFFFGRATPRMRGELRTAL